MRKKIKHSNPPLKTSLLSSLFFLLFTASLFSLDVKKNADTPGSEITDSKLEANKAPLDLDDSVESIKEVERSNDGRRKAKKHSLTPEQLKKKKEIIEKVLKYGSNKERKEAMRELAHLSTDGDRKSVV